MSNKEIEQDSKESLKTSKSLFEMKGNPHNNKMLETLQNCTKVLAGKRCDYGDDNFVKASKVASILTGKVILPKDVAACLIGIKMARYGNITGPGVETVNEPIQDTIEDWINYIVLMERERDKLDEACKSKKTDVSSM